MSWGGQDRPPAGTTQPTRARVCELAGFGVSTYKVCRAWWEARGYVAIARPGRTPMLRPVALVRPGDHNERQVLVICCPRKKRPISSPRSGQAITRPLTCSGSEQVLPTREAKPAEKPGSGTIRPAALRAWPLRGVSDGWWLYLTRPFVRLSWLAGAPVTCSMRSTTNRAAGPAVSAWRMSCIRTGARCHRQLSSAGVIQPRSRADSSRNPGPCAAARYRTQGNELVSAEPVFQKSR